MSAVCYTCIISNLCNKLCPLPIAHSRDSLCPLPRLTFSSSLSKPEMDQGKICLTRTQEELVPLVAPGDPKPLTTP